MSVANGGQPERTERLAGIVAVASRQVETDLFSGSTSSIKDLLFHVEISVFSPVQMRFFGVRPQNSSLENQMYIEWLRRS